jgi:hypothetical protein
MSKEHEVIMLLNKGRDMLSRSAHRNSSSGGGSDTRNLQRDLDKIQQQWDRLRKDTVERHTRLQTCMVRKHFIFWCYNCGILAMYSTKKNVMRFNESKIVFYKYELGIAQCLK